MPGKFDYTATARRFWVKFPILTFVSIQVNFWVIANLLLGIILHLQALRISVAFRLRGATDLGPIIIISIIFGILYGTILGLVGHYLEKTFYRKKSLGKIILFNTVLALGVLATLLALAKYFLAKLLLSEFSREVPLDNQSWKYFFIIAAIYYLFMTVLINFINQVNKKYGPGVLVPLLLGKYRMPREEERIFMFMDLRSSTSLAERLGHLKYSAFIRDSFMDINNVVSACEAEIYQYVGDEIVLTWRMRDDITNASCVEFYFACCDEFLQRASYYQEEYGLLPEFKAGLHGGLVTAVEIGNIKRDIAYHGDVLNTAARIQGLCNEYKQHLLVSTTLLQNLHLSNNRQAVIIGSVTLKGKARIVEIAGISNSSVYP